MSVSFSLARFDAAADMFVPVCEADHSVCVNVACLDDPYAGMGFCECSFAAREACELCGAGVNLANGNAVLVLERLGFDVDPECLFGEASGSDLLARALVGNVGRSDDGVPAAVDGRMIDCGVRPGYFAERLGALTDLAVLADRLGALVVWS
jgi:hypothetical protein